MPYKEQGTVPGVLYTVFIQMLKASLGGGHCEPRRSLDEESVNKLSNYQVTNTVRAGIKPDQCNLWRFPVQ